jgi:hypothetical protein
MQLATFGAILTHGIELERGVSELYQLVAGTRAGGPFGDLALACDKRMRRLERIRVEGVAEMILEPITGLDGEDYAITLDAGGSEDMKSLLPRLLSAEEAACRFYQQASVKMPIGEVARQLLKIAREHEENLKSLQASLNAHDCS